MDNIFQFDKLTDWNDGQLFIIYSIFERIGTFQLEKFTDNNEVQLLII